jgi:hypothetical protein
MLKQIKAVKSHISRFRWFSGYVGSKISFALVWAELWKSQEPISIKFFSFPSIFVRPNTTDILMSIQVLANQEYDFKITKSPSVIVDAGANIGASSIFLDIVFPRLKS